MQKIALLLLSALLLLISIQNACAQTSTNNWYLHGKTNNDKVAGFKNRILLVRLQSEDKKEIAHLEKKGHTEELKFYRQSITHANDLLRKGVSLAWSFSPVQFRTADEIQELLSAAPGQYMVISRSNFNARYLTMENEEVRKGLILHADGSRVCESIVPESREPSHLDFTYAVRQIQNMLQMDAALRKGYLRKKENVYTLSLKEKTLLIDSAYMEGPVPMEIIKRIYPHPLKIVSTDQINKALESRDSTVAYVMVIQSVDRGIGYPFYTKLVVSAADGKIFTKQEPALQENFRLTQSGGINAGDIKKFAEVLRPKPRKFAFFRDI